MQLNEDGSLDIYIQHERPDSGISNWLPAPREEFIVILRLYYPRDRFINGEWTIPPFEKVETLWVQAKTETWKLITQGQNHLFESFLIVLDVQGVVQVQAISRGQTRWWKINESDPLILGIGGGQNSGGIYRDRPDIRFARYWISE